MVVVPEWTFEWLKVSPFSHAKFRVRPSELLFKLGESIVNKAEKAYLVERDEVPTVHQLLMAKQEKGIRWTHGAISAEISGQVLAATETTSSALALIFYELAQNNSPPGEHL